MLSFRKLTLLLLWLTIFTMPFMNSFMIPGLGSINRIISIVLALVAIYTVVLHQRIKKLPGIFYAMFLFLIWILATCIWALDLESALVQIIMFTQLFLFAWIIYEFVDHEFQILNLFKAYIYGCLIVSFMTIVEYRAASGSLESSRFFLEEYNPNGLGQVLAFGLPLAFFLALKGSKRFILYFPIALFMMFILSSRTVLIVMSVILISSLWMMFKYKVRFRKTILLTLFGVGLFVYNRIPAANIERLSTIDEELSSGTLNNRTLIWEAGVKAFQDHAILGAGINNFGNAVAPYLGIPSSPHNTYLSIATETGVIGLLIFVIILLYIIYYAIKSNAQSRMRWLSMTIVVSWLAISLVGHPEEAKFTWILFGMIITMYHIQSRETFTENFKVVNKLNLPKIRLRGSL